MAFTQKTLIQLSSFNFVELGSLQLTDVSFTGITLTGATVYGAHSAGDTTIEVTHSTDIPTGCVVSIAGQSTGLFYVSEGLLDGDSARITVSPGIDTDLAGGESITILPHHDITNYVTSVSDLDMRSEANRNEFVLDGQIYFELFNKDSSLYDYDTHSTAWSLATSYFTTHNEQSTRDNKYIRISIKIGGTWYQKYVGSIVRDELSVDVRDKVIKFMTESVFYGLRDIRLYSVPDIYNGHDIGFFDSKTTEGGAITSDTWQTPTVSGRVIDIIVKMFKTIGIPTSVPYDVTNKAAEEVAIVQPNYYGEITLSIGTHDVRVGEYITVNIGDRYTDGKHVVTGTTSTTITYPKTVWTSETCLTTGTASIGGTSIAIAGFPTMTSLGIHKVRFSGHSTIYDCHLFSPTSLICDTVGGWTSAIASGETVYVYLVTEFDTSISVADGVIAHRVIFDDYGDYFSETRKGWLYEFDRIFFETQLWRKETIEESTCWDVLNDFMTAFCAVSFVDYIAGVPYGFFRSKLNDSTSKGTIDDVHGQCVIKGNWREFSESGIPAVGEFEYFNGESARSAYKYSGESWFTGYFYKIKWSGIVNENSLLAGDEIEFATHSTKYLITQILTAVSSKSITSWDRDDYTVKVTTSSAHGFTNEQIVTVSGTGGGVADGTFQIVVTSTTTFEYDTYSSGTNSGASGSVEALETAILSPKLKQSIKQFTPYFITNDEFININFPEAYTVKLWYPDIFWVLDSSDPKFSWNDATEDVRYVGNYNTTTLGQVSAHTLNSLCIVPLCPFGYSSDFPAGDALILSTTLSSTSYLKYISTDSPVGVGENDIYSAGSSVFVGHISGVYYTDFNNVENENAPQFIVYFGQAIDIYRIALQMNNQGEYNDLDYGGSPPSNHWDYGFSRLERRETTPEHRVDAVAKSLPLVIGGHVPNGSILNPASDGFFWFVDDDDIYRQPVLFSKRITAHYTGSGTALHNIDISGDNTYGQKVYTVSESTNLVYVSDNATWTSFTTLCGGGATSPGVGLATNDESLGNPVAVRKAYGRYVVIVDNSNAKILIYDIASDYTIGVVSAGASIGEALVVRDFIRQWGDSGEYYNILHSASKKQYEMFSKNRRRVHAEARLSIDFALYDRFAIDASMLSASSGNPMFYVEGYRINWETHDYQIDFLEYVE